MVNLTKLCVSQVQMKSLNEVVFNRCAHFVYYELPSGLLAGIKKQFCCRFGGEFHLNALFLFPFPGL